MVRNWEWIVTLPINRFQDLLDATGEMPEQKFCHCISFLFVEVLFSLFVIQTLDILLQILVVFPKIEPLRNKVRIGYGAIEAVFFFVWIFCWLYILPKDSIHCIQVTSFIHRMVDTLGASVFPCLPKALGQLLAESEVKRKQFPVYRFHSYI